MNFEPSIQTIESEIPAPEWFGGYTERVRTENLDPLAEIKKLENMKYEEVNKYLGGDIKELPYEFLSTLFIDGSDDQEIAMTLRTKREKYLVNHPEMWQGGNPENVQGIIKFDGTFVPNRMWVTASDSEKRGALVGSTCFHYNSETPGMGSDPKDRF